MKVRVLGSAGSRSRESGTSCLLVDDRLLLDAGAAASGLSLAEQLAIEDVLISHAHLDHVAELPYLLDNGLDRRRSPLRVWAPPAVLSALHRHLFNDVLWPDFTRLPREAPALRLCPLVPGRSERIAGLTVRWEETRHTVPAAGYLLEDEGKGILYSGDTAATERLWQLGRGCRSLQAVFVETTFPDRLNDLAELTGHLTPQVLQAELRKLDRPAVPVKVFHLKPRYQEEILAEIGALSGHRFQVLAGGEEFTI